MSFTNIFKKSFLEGYTGAEITPTNVTVALCITALIGLYIFFVYRILTRKVFYSKTFNITLSGIAVITAAIILTIQSSIVVSLGMVGALSIVRFRTAIKEPMDLMFLFWSIGAGIMCGAGLAEIAVIMSIILTVYIIILDKMPVAKTPMLLIISADAVDSEDDIIIIVNKYSKYHRVKSRNTNGRTLNLVIELSSRTGKELVKDISNLENVQNVNLMNHDGEVTF